MGTTPIVELRANVKPEVSTSADIRATTGFSYILNVMRFSCAAAPLAAAASSKAGAPATAASGACVKTSPWQEWQR
jgi:hypothetical protein